MGARQSCPNMNHGRTNPPIRFCPLCGEMVNRAVTRTCDKTAHLSRRKNRDQYCVDCGKKLTD
jgi:hypothetical protein